MAPSRQCGVCKVAASKYKCPSCLLPYCSLTCFKKHKEVPCGVPSPPPEKKAPLALPERSCQVYEESCVLQREQLQSLAPLALPKRSCQVYEESCVLQREQLQSLVNCPEILDALKNEQLRNLICKIDCSEDPEDELEKAMDGQSFRDFTDKILSICQPDRAPI